MIAINKYIVHTLIRQSRPAAAAIALR